MTFHVDGVGRMDERLDAKVKLPSNYPNVCSIVVDVGLAWKARGGERSTFDGRDASGRFYAHVTNISGPWTIYLAPWACGREGGLATGRFEDAAEAMAEADRIVAAHVETA